MKKMKWIFEFSIKEGETLEREKQEKLSRDWLTNFIVSGLRSVNTGGGDTAQMLVLLAVKDKIKKLKENKKLVLENEEFRLIELAGTGKFPYELDELVVQFAKMVKDVETVEDK